MRVWKRVSLGDLGPAYRMMGEAGLITMIWGKRDVGEWDID